jgi:hypothetical protein
VSSLGQAKENLQCGSLTSREALFYGLVPGMIYLAKSGEPGHIKRDRAIQKCVALVSEESMRYLLASFFDGNPKLVFAPLLHLMDTGKVGNISWIPYHMTEVLRDFGRSASLSQSMRLGLGHVVEHFQQFRDSKEGSGDGWEALLVATLLMRALSGKFDTTCFKLNGAFQAPACTVSFNMLLERNDAHRILSVDEFVDQIREPYSYPHIGIFCPHHASFEDVDVIVAAWSEKGKRILYGYQLREGKKLPQKMANSLFNSCWAIRGDPPKKGKDVLGWAPVNASDVNEFFGYSGKQWTPKRWKKLNETCQ